MGIVHAATEIATGNMVAIKILRPSAVRFAFTFTRERDALQALAHPNIVRYLGHGETREGLPYLVTEWLEGEDLEARLARGKLSVAAAVDHAIAIASALGAAHAQGIVHRDVKPANIHLGKDGVARLLDFGLAHLGGHAGTVAVGTALYMAPEQVRAAGTIDARSDVYALGCVLFECLTGRPPFTGDRATVVLAKAIFELPPRVTSLGVEASPELDALVARTLSKHAGARPRSGEEAAALLTQCPLTWSRGASSFAATESVEQRIGCVALIRTAPTEGHTTTIADGDAPDLVARLSTLADEYGVDVAGLVDGTLLVAAKDVEPTDQGTRLANFAREMVTAFPESAAALATGTLGGTAASAVERAEDLLRRTAPGEVRTCTATARVLAGGSENVLGRDATLDSLLAVAADAGSALVIGEAALGKTCIVHALTRRVEASGRTVLLLRGEVHRAGSPLAPFAAWLRDRLGLVGAADPALVRIEIARRLGDGSAHHAAALLRVLGHADEDHPRGQARDPVKHALVAFLVAEAREKNGVVLVDDAQWLDAASVKVLELLLARDAGIALVVFGRPGAEALFSSLGRTGLRLALGPLDPSASRDLALGTFADLDEPQIEALLARAEGHPFVIRELARAARERLTSVPDTVLGIVQARLARLSDGARRAARAAALLGMHFTSAGVARLVGEAADEGLEALISARIVQREGGGDLSFASPLVAEAAYELFGSEDRAVVHARAALWLGEQADRDAAVVAWHEERGGQPARAAVAYAEAARRALDLGDLGSSIAHARRGVACGPDGEVLGALRLSEAEALVSSGEIREGDARAREALSLLEEGSARWMAAMCVRARAGGWHADIPALRAMVEPLTATSPKDRAAEGLQLFALARVAANFLALSYRDEAKPVYEEALRRASRLSLTVGERATVHRLRANWAEDQGEWTIMMNENNSAADLWSAIGERKEWILARVCAGGADMEVGRFNEAIARFEETTENGSDLGLRYLAAYSRYLHGRTLRRCGRPDEAESALSAALADTVGDPRLAAQAHTELARIALERGDLDEARERADLAIELTTWLPSCIAHARAVRAAVYLAEDDEVGALAEIERAAVVARVDFPSGDDPSYVWLVYLKIVSALGREIGDVTREARAGLMGRAMRVGDENVQRTFLALPDNVAILAYAEKLGVTSFADG